MMKIVCFPLIIAVVVQHINCSCDPNLPEQRFLNNVDKLLNQSFVRIGNGVRLRKNSNILDNRGNQTSACKEISRTFIQEIDKRFQHVFNTHVLELDLANIFSIGKNYLIYDYDINFQFLECVHFTVVDCGSFYSSINIA